MENVGQIILKQMQAINKPVLWSWGSHAYKTFKQTDLPNLKPHLGGLLFRVKGYKHQGNVIVSLQSNDLYHIYIGQLRKGQMTIKSEHADIYVEDLMDVLDQLIET
jgi:hypothetical protein